LTVLVDRSAKRCPSCHAKLRSRRSQPIVLGEASRLDVQATLAVDKRNKERGVHTYDIAPPASAAPVAPDPVEPEPELVAIAVETPDLPPQPQPEPEPFVAPPFETEPVVDQPVAVADAIAAFTLPERAPVVAVPEPDPEPEPEPTFEPERAVVPVFALDDDVASRAKPSLTAELDSTLEELNSMVDELHRKARGEGAVDAAPPVDQIDPEVDLTALDQIDTEDRPSPLRLMGPRAGNRRRWTERDF
jgi:hypothetical protein